MKICLPDFIAVFEAKMSILGFKNLKNFPKKNDKTLSDIFQSPDFKVEICITVSSSFGLTVLFFVYRLLIFIK